MSYYFTKMLETGFDKAVDKVTEALKDEGFGVLTDIDVKETLRKKLDVDFRRYRILGACNPPNAYEVLMAEDKIGLMLPCNVIVQEWEEGRVEVSVIDPIASMQAVKNESLAGPAVEIRKKLKKVVDSI